MKKPKFDNIWLGLTLGVVGFFVGFILLGIIWAMVEDSTLQFFVETAFIDTPIYRVRILSASCILNVILFFIFFQKGWLELSKGMVGALLLAVLAILIFY